METTQCLQSKRQILVVGSRESKRTIYFAKSGEALGYTVKCIEWEVVEESDLASSIFVKIDPPRQIGVTLEQLEGFSKWYNEVLQRLDKQNAAWSNTPRAICETLDKVECKKRLEERGIATTPRLNIEADSYEILFQKLVEKRVTNIFIKPRYGSGAAGVIAYRYHLKTHQAMIYTSLKIGEDGKLYNTKHMFKLTGHEKIKEMVDQLLEHPVIIEKWVQKAQYEGLSYDLRVVYQYGQIDHIVVRGSKNPITNLHLNNCAIPIEKLHLNAGQMQELADLCKRVVDCFEGLNIAGIDVLMTPSGKFKVVEVNGQGDLIYQDIFNGNRIYTRQIIEGIKKDGRYLSR